MKEVLAKKRPIEDGSMPGNKDKSCAISPERKIPIKQKDPGSVAIPCTVKGKTFKVLIDSGFSVSLVPLSICQRLGIEKIRRSGTKLKFVDHTIK